MQIAGQEVDSAVHLRDHGTGDPQCVGESNVLLDLLERGGGLVENVIGKPVETLSVGLDCSWDFHGACF